MPLQTEMGKIHAPHGTLPWEPQHLLRPFTPTGEAAGAAQPPPPPGPSVGRGRGRPKSAAKCDRCSKRCRDCGPSCPQWPGHQLNTQTATPTQLPARAALAAPLLQPPGAAASSSGPHPPLAGVLDAGQVAVASYPDDAASAQAAPTASELAQAQTPTSDGAAAEHTSSSRARVPRDLDRADPSWSSRSRDQRVAIDNPRRRRQRRQRRAGGDGSEREGEEERALTSTRARALS